MTDAAAGVWTFAFSGGPGTDVRTVRLAGRAQYEPLLEAGVRIYEWQPTTLHAEAFVVDGLWATIGSMNFDNRSLTLNDESTLMILDETVGNQMNAVFLEDLKHAEEIMGTAPSLGFVVGRHSAGCWSGKSFISLGVMAI